MASPQKENGYTPIANEILEQIIKEKLNGTQFRILIAVWRNTYGFKRKSHEISDVFLSKAIGVPRQQIAREIKPLIERNIILVLKNAKYNASKTIAFNKDYGTWITASRPLFGRSGAYGLQATKTSTGNELNASTESMTGNGLDASTESMTGNRLDAPTGNELDASTGNELDACTGNGLDACTGNRLDACTGNELDASTGNELDAQERKIKERSKEKDLKNICARVERGTHTKTNFVKPTLQEVEAYCTQRNNFVDAQRFLDFYESKGWMIGKNKMKDWKASVRTWEKNSDRQNRTSIPKHKQLERRET